MQPKIFALIPAAGTGSRLGDSLPKQYLDLNGRPMIHHSLAALFLVPRISAIRVLLSPDDMHWHQFDFSIFNAKLNILNCGGSSRSATVLNALNALKDECADDDWILVHDAARPCVRSELIEKFLNETEQDAVGGLLAMPVADTIKRGDNLQRVATTISREKLWRAQTPQMFRYALLRTALQQFPEATDEAQAIESLGHLPRLVIGAAANFKVTYSDDIKMARALLNNAI